jgi:hypothetical protein
VKIKLTVINTSIGTIDNFGLIQNHNKENNALNNCKSSFVIFVVAKTKIMAINTVTDE